MTVSVEIEFRNSINSEECSKIMTKFVSADCQQIVLNYQ
jgi:hypothetical protein